MPATALDVVTVPRLEFYVFRVSGKTVQSHRFVSHCKLNYTVVIAWDMRGCLALAEVPINVAILHEFGRRKRTQG